MTQFEHPQDIIVPQPRTSVLAVTSLVLQVLCCIPGIGAIGALVGVGAIFGISKSDGRVRGMGLAVAGVVLGLISTLIWIVTVTFVASMFKSMSDYSQIIVAVEADDSQTVRTWVTNANLTDEQITAFGDALQAEHGSYVGAPTSIAGILGGYGEVERSGVSVNRAINDAQAVAFNPFPVVVEFDSGFALLMVTPDTTGPQVPNSNLPTVENIAYVASDGSLVWLIDIP